MITVLQELIDTHSTGTLDLSDLPLQGAKFPTLLANSLDLTGSDICGVTLPQCIEGDLLLNNCLADSTTVFPMWISGTVYLTQEMHSLMGLETEITYH